MWMMPTVVALKAPQQGRVYARMKKTFDKKFMRLYLFFYEAPWKSNMAALTKVGGHEKYWHNSEVQLGARHPG